MLAELKFNNLKNLFLIYLKNLSETGYCLKISARRKNIDKNIDI